MKECQVTTDNIIQRANNAIKRMEEAMTKNEGINKSTQYTNYMFSCGEYYAFMQILHSMNKEIWMETAISHRADGQLNKLEKAADELYRELRQGVEVNY